jgi:hypothetical protein
MDSHKLIIDKTTRALEIKRKDSSAFDALPNSTGEYDIDGNEIPAGVYICETTTVIQKVKRNQPPVPSGLKQETEKAVRAIIHLVSQVNHAIEANNPTATEEAVHYLNSVIMYASSLLTDIKSISSQN